MRLGAASKKRHRRKRGASRGFLLARFVIDEIADESIARKVVKSVTSHACITGVYHIFEP
jgi:hypothetical protein